MTDAAKDFCVVGLGPHARNKLIPALVSCGQRVLAVVTSGNDSAGTGARIFADLGDAIAALPSDTVFLVATPPALHFAQTKAIVESGHDVVVEKPAFVTRRDAEQIEALCARSGRIVFEAFMHRYTDMYGRLRAVWEKDAAKIAAIETRVLIPPTAGAPTFRDNDDIASSIVFDIGCYPLSLLSDLGLGNVALTIAQAHGAGDVGNERLRLAGRGIGVEIGRSDSYENWVRFDYRDGSSKTFRPFYYGRPGEKSIVAARDGAETAESFQDHNAFEAMLKPPRAFWAAEQRKYGAGMIEVTGKLEELGRELLRLRQGKSA